MQSATLHRRAPFAASRPQLKAPRQALVRPGRVSTVRCRADLNNAQRSLAGVLKSLERYDFVSTGLGAMVVTGFFWMNGQSVGEALSITVLSTITALVVNELMFPDDGGTL